MKSAEEVDQDFSGGRYEKAPPHPKETTMDDDTIAKCVFSAAEEAFAAMLGLHLMPGEPKIEKQEDGVGSERVVALIGLAGCYNGTGIMSCSPALACRLSSKMLAEDLPVINSEVLGAMGEISNIIFGHVKNMLEKQFGPLALSIPTIVFGRNFRTASIGERCVTVTVKVEEDNLNLCMCVSRRPSHSQHDSAQP